jgi:hypothetical protein
MKVLMHVSVLGFAFLHFYCHDEYDEYGDLRFCLFLYFKNIYKKIYLFLF